MHLCLITFIIFLPSKDIRNMKIQSFKYFPFGVMILTGSGSDLRHKEWGKKNSLTGQDQSCLQSWKCFWNGEKGHYSHRKSLFWSYVSHQLSLKQSLSLASMPYSRNGGNTHLCQGQALKLLSIKDHRIPGCAQAVLRWQWAGLSTQLLCLILMSPHVKCWAIFQTCAR